MKRTTSVPAAALWLPTLLLGACATAPDNPPAPAPRQAAVPLAAQQPAILLATTADGAVLYAGEEIGVDGVAPLVQGLLQEGPRAVVVPDFEDPHLIRTARIELERIVAQIIGLVWLVAWFPRDPLAETDVQRCTVSADATIFDVTSSIESASFTHVQQTHYSRIAVQIDLVAEHRHILHALIRRHDPRRP